MKVKDSCVPEFVLKELGKKAEFWLRELLTFNWKSFFFNFWSFLNNAGKSGSSLYRKIFLLTENPCMESYSDVKSPSQTSIPWKILSVENFPRKKIHPPSTPKNPYILPNNTYYMQTMDKFYNFETFSQTLWGVILSPKK